MSARYSTVTRFISKSLKVLLSIIMIFVTLLIGAWFALDAILISEVDVATVYSPDTKTMAIVEETNGGATTSFGYNIYLKSNSIFGFRRKAAYLYGAVRSKCAYGVNIIWPTSTRIEIQYLHARGGETQERSLLVGTKSIDVSFQSEIDDSSAPCGGMEYNL